MRDKRRQSGRGRVTCPFFDELDRLLHDYSTTLPRHYLEPAACVLPSTHDDWLNQLENEKEDAGEELPWKTGIFLGLRMLTMPSWKARSNPDLLQWTLIPALSCRSQSPSQKTRLGPKNQIPWRELQQVGNLSLQFIITVGRCELEPSHSLPPFAISKWHISRPSVPRPVAELNTESIHLCKIPQFVETLVTGK